MTLTEFLLARITEDEAAWSGGVGLVTRPDFARMSQHMLAECEAKRSMIDILAPIAADLWPSTELAKHVLAVMALPYADHPDYLPEWRP